MKSKVKDAQKHRFFLFFMKFFTVKNGKWKMDKVHES